MLMKLTPGSKYFNKMVIYVRNVMKKLFDFTPYIHNKLNNPMLPKGSIY